MLDLLDVGFKDMSKHRFVVYIRQSCAYAWYMKKLF